MDKVCEDNCLESDITSLESWQRCMFMIVQQCVNTVTSDDNQPSNSFRMFSHKCHILNVMVLSKLSLQ